jgi:rhamnulokinase
MPAYLAVDLGAESGRVFRGEFDGNRLTVEEVHRFANGAVAGDGLYWDVHGLYAQALDGIARGMGSGSEVRSVGVDAWGNDFGLVDGDGCLLAPAWHHRTPRTAGMVDRLFSLLDPDDLYEVTGTQFLPITTACQLLAMRAAGELDRAQRLALLPDLFAFWLSGVAVTEQTIASTSQLWDIRLGRWATGVIERLGLPVGLFAADVVAPGTRLGPVRGVAEELAGPRPPGVVTVAGHDTACAVAAVPADSAEFGYVSCGTWSLVGVQIAQPITTPRARQANFTNELGVGGTVRFLSNVNGLWLLQECRREWAGAGAPPSYTALTRDGSRCAAFRSLIDPDDASLLGPGGMPARIAALCRANGEPVPRNRGEVVRCILDSLACKYRWVLERATALVGRPMRTVHLVGGGAANALLCQQTADVTGWPVVAGPVEATGIGNLLVQAMADGQLAGLAEVRSVVRESFPPQTYQPTADRLGVGGAYARFDGMMLRRAGSSTDATSRHVVTSPAIT